MSCRLAIVGGGPLCTYALERLAAYAMQGLDGRLEITVFERTGRFGAGMPHSDSQPATSYMNRVAGQISLGADERDVGATELLPADQRQTFLDWCRARYRETGDPVFDLGRRDVPKRFLHGLALRDAFDRYVALLRSSGAVTVTLEELEVDDVRPGDPDGFELEAGGDWFPVDRILFATGHSRNRSASTDAAPRPTEDGGPPRYLSFPYPLDERLSPAAVPPGSVVGVLGLGLTAIDVFLYLTEGRGGRFESDLDGRLGYVSGGQEPALMIGVGPSGTLPTCRPDNHKVGAPELEHRGVFLTTAAIERLRETAGVPARVGGQTMRQLDFDLQVFPLLVLEMAYVYYRALLGDLFARRLRTAARRAYGSFLAAPPSSSSAGIATLLEPVQRCFDAAVESAVKGADELRRFDWETIFDPLPDRQAADGDAWRDQVVAAVRRDLAAASEGNLRSPVKAACDGVWRDLRAELSAAVDYGGLTASSHRAFISEHLRHYNRLSNGPGREAMQKVLALVEHGILDISVGPGPVVTADSGGFRIEGPSTGVAREADVLVEGRMHAFNAAADAAGLYPNLLRRGMVRMWRNPGLGAGGDFVPGGLDLDVDSHPIAAGGDVDPRLTFLGAPAEGVRSFQLSVGRPGSNVLEHVAGWAREIAATVTVGAEIAVHD